MTNNEKEGNNICSQIKSAQKIDLFSSPLETGINYKSFIRKRPMVM